MPKKQYEVVYRRPIGARKLAGNPAEARPGDMVVFFDEGRFTTRECLEVHKGHLIMAPLVYKGVLADSTTYKVKFEDIDEVLREKREEAQANPSGSEPPPPPPDLENTQSIPAMPMMPNTMGTTSDGIRAPGKAVPPQRVVKPKKS